MGEEAKGEKTMKLSDLSNEKKSELLDALNEYASSNFDDDPIENVEDLNFDEDGLLSLAISARREHEVQAFYDIENEALVYYVDGEPVESELCPIDEFTYWIKDADCDEDVLDGCASYLRLLYLPLEERAEEILKGIKYAEVGCGLYWGKNYYVEAVDKDYNSKWYFVDDIEELADIQDAEG